MNNLVGLKVISNKSTSKVQTVDFVIIEHKKTSAIKTLINCIDAGQIIDLNDNRNKREGLISLKRENGVYLQSGGGHGFSIDWKPVNIEDVILLIKVTAPFNYSVKEGNYGTIKQNS